MKKGKTINSIEIMSEKLCVDFGGVICNNQRTPKGSTNSFENPDPKALGYLLLEQFPDAFETLRILKERRFPEIFLVSKLTENIPNVSVEERVRNYLMYHGFEEVILGSRMHFCEKREDKVKICAELEAFDYFLDDRLDVLCHMVGTVRNLFLFDPDRAEGHERWHLVEEGKVTVVRSWREVHAHLR